jgi:Holliday junction resolvase-like predicted endonuclease
MPSRDIYHNTVKNALEKTGWKITADPLFIKYGEIYIVGGQKSVLTLLIYLID